MPRFIDPNLHYHVIVRCNNKAFLFESEEDFLEYLSVLHWVQRKHLIKIYNYEIMNSHVHLFVQPGPQIPFYKTMQLLNWKYAIQYNRRKNRQGHFWISHYQCVPVESDHYSLVLMRYMNRNPLRAGMVKKNGDWKWSAYRFYAFGEAHPFLIPHISYLALGDSDKKRQQEYRNFVNDLLMNEDKKNPHFSEGPFIGSLAFTKRI